MPFINNDSIVPYVAPPRFALKENPLKALMLRCFSEKQYLATYKALHLGGEKTLESKMIRATLTSCNTHSEKETAERLSKYHQISGYLSKLNKQSDFVELLKGATLINSGTGGDVFTMEVEGIPLIVKKIRLTETELSHPKSTQNLFNLPSYYQYGVWSYGFGVWREVKAHEMTTKWVLNGKCQNFPLMYHSTVLNRPNAPEKFTKEQTAERKEHVEYWNGSKAIEKRIRAMHSAPSDVIIFMEKLPGTLRDKMRLDGEKGNLSESSLNRLEQELNKVLVFMKSKGFLHLDAHFSNIFASGNHLYFGDFGLTLSTQFDLSKEERDFLEKHRDYDRNLVMTSLALIAIYATAQKGGMDLEDSYCANGKMTRLIPSSVESIAKKYRPMTILMSQFFKNMRKPSKSEVYPKDALDRQWDKGST